MKILLYLNEQQNQENLTKGGADMVEAKIEANIVRDFEIGNTRIKIADNYCKKTACEVEQLLKRIATQMQRQFNIAAATGKYEQQENKDVSVNYS